MLSNLQLRALKYGIGGPVQPALVAQMLACESLVQSGLMRRAANGFEITEAGRRVYQQHALAIGPNALELRGLRLWLAPTNERPDDGSAQRK